MFFKKKFKLDVVPESEYTDFSDRLTNNSKYYATKKTIIAASIPLAVAIPIVASKLTSSAEAYSVTTIPVAASVPIEPSLPIHATESAINILAQSNATIPVNMASPEVIQTGIIADKSLETLATVLDPVVQILTAISFPIASVIMVGACFFFMLGNSEKAWQMIMNAGLGYVLIQLSPLFLQILRTVGESV